jgi:hypothetical protein
MGPARGTAATGVGGGWCCPEVAGKCGGDFEEGLPVGELIDSRQTSAVLRRAGPPSTARACCGHHDLTEPAAMADVQPTGLPLARGG